MAKSKNKKTTQTKKSGKADEFIAYQMFKARNRIGAEYGGSVSNVLKGESLG